MTVNIVDCYAASLQMWQLGDRIFLFGFSRGAYTVRCTIAIGMVTLCIGGGQGIALAIEVLH